MQLSLGTIEAGWTFTGWSASLIDDKVTINGNTEVTATFNQEEYALTVVSAHAPVTKNPISSPTPTAGGAAQPRYHRGRLDLHRLEPQPDR